MKIYLVDGTYELFRHFYSPAPNHQAPDGREVGATRGLLATLLKLLRERGTHVGVAFDHVIESFRNELFDGYKTGLGIDPELRQQFPLAEDAVRALGLVVWPMVEFEADDALAAAAARFRDHPDVEQVVICTPDKDLAQCVRGDRVVLLDRRRQRFLNEQDVIERYGVPPTSIPDWLALVGDSADGIPGLKGWGKKSASRVLTCYGHLENIPPDAAIWEVKIRGASGLAATLRAHWREVTLYRRLATLREDAPVEEDPGALAWQLSRDELATFCQSIACEDLLERIP